MNAGAFGVEIADLILSVKILRNKRVEILSKSDIVFKHRYSSFQDQKITILEVCLQLKNGGVETIENKMKQNLVWRLDNQPSGKSAGSVFKRGVEPAGALIDRAGLKGFAIGDAVISKKHANFIINSGSATAFEILQLIKHIKNEVYLKFGILLQEEIIYIGE